MTTRRNPILIGQAEEFDLVLSQVRAMIENEGVYICGDTVHPAFTVPLVSYDGKILSLVAEAELDPERFIPSFTAHGPYLASTHPDDFAVDRFAAALKAKLAKKRAEGMSGWDDKTACSEERLQTMLVEHLDKGDPVDVGNFAMMLFNRGESCAAPAPNAAAITRAANWLRSKAEKHAQENGYHEPDTGAFVFVGQAAAEWNNGVLELADEMEAALGDVFDNARLDMDVIRKTLGVPLEPHQSLIERMVEAAQKKVAKPDIAEVERLVDEYATAVHDGRDGDCVTGRTALLDYVRGVMAERDQFRDAAKMVSAAPQPVGEVPMPDADMFDQQAHIFAHSTDQLRTYGDAREAAGYAAGVAAVRDYAVMRWCAEVSNRPLVNTHRRTLDDTWRQVIRHTGGDPETLIGPCHDVLVALRGEVKP